MSEHPIETREAGRKFAPKQKPRADGHAMDQAGEALIAMVNEAATLSNENRDRLADLVDDLSRRLEAAQDRINQLQTTSSTSEAALSVLKSGSRSFRKRSRKHSSAP